MLNEKLLASNVLRRIYKDSVYEATQLKLKGISANLAGFPEASTRFFDEQAEYNAIVRTTSTELKARGESLT